MCHVVANTSKGFMAKFLFPDLHNTKQRDEWLPVNYSSKNLVTALDNKSNSQQNLKQEYNRFDLMYLFVS